MNQVNADLVSIRDFFQKCKKKTYLLLNDFKNIFQNVDKTKFNRTSV